MSIFKQRSQGTTLEEIFDSKNPRKDAKNMRCSKDLRVKEGKKRGKKEKGEERWRRVM